MLTLNWSDLENRDRQVVFNDEGYFLEKKKLLIENSRTDKKMRSLHSKVKTMTGIDHTKAVRADIMQQLNDLDKQRINNWKVIDDWKEPEKVKTQAELTVEEAVRRAMERDKIIRAHKIYIYRAEKLLPGLPSETRKQKDKIEYYKKQIVSRKMELKELGAKPNKSKK